MRLLVTSVAGLGHLHPVLPLTLAAAATGHEVRVATGADQVAWVRRCGADAEPSGLSHADLVQQSDSLGLVGKERPRQLFTTLAMPPMVEDLLALVERWRPDGILHEEGEYAAPLVAALRGLPCVTHSWPAPARTAAGRAFLDEPLGRVWERFGASGRPRQYGQLYLDACPPLLQVADLSQVQGRVVSVHPSGFDGPPEQPPPWLTTLPRPAVYVTLGTEPTFCRPELLQRLVDAAAAITPGVVVSTGAHPPEVIRPPHDGVRVTKYLPQSLVLAHVDAVIGHGGAGTTLGALLHGLPLLIVPGIAPSQQGSAERVVAAGVGLRVDWPDASPLRLRAAVTDLLAGADLRSMAQAARTDLDSLPKPAELVPLVEAEIRGE